MSDLDPRFQLRRLDNGLTVLFERMAHVPSAAAGIFVRTGARDETPDVQGVSHFLEHMMFKGTARRTAAQINIDFDRIGATYNAFTANENTCYYGWVPAADLRALLDILTDMMTSVLPPDEFDMEKKVILEEIAMYEDNLEMHTIDQLLERGFSDHPLGGSVLGTVETVSGLTRDAMHDYFRRRYNPANMLLVVCGNFDPDETLRAVESSCAGWTAGAAGRDQPEPSLRDGQHVIPKDRFQRQTLCLAFEAPAGPDPDTDAADMAALVLGKPDNSRLFWNITNRGLAESARAYFWDFTDAGLFILYAVAAPDKARTVLDALRAECEAFTTEGASDEEIERARNQIKTSFALQAEVPFHRLLQIADDMERIGRPRTPEERIDDFNRVNSDAVKNCLQRHPITGEGALVSVGPLETLA